MLPSTTTGGYGRKDNSGNNGVSGDDDGGAFVDSINGIKYDCREKATDRSHSGVGTNSNGRAGISILFLSGESYSSTDKETTTTTTTMVGDVR